MVGEPVIGNLSRGPPKPRGCIGALLLYNPVNRENRENPAHVFSCKSCSSFSCFFFKETLKSLQKE